MKKILIGITIIFLLSFIFPLLTFAQQASYYLSPTKGDYKIGEQFSVKVFVSVEGIAINAAQAAIYFPADKLKVVRISKVSSIFTLWVEEPVFSNSRGKISFLGGLPSPGYLGAAGQIISILFQAKNEGTARVTFSGEKILANDPWGTNIFSSSTGGEYNIREGEVPVEPSVKKPDVPKINSPTHPNEDAWYDNNNPEFNWDLPKDITGLSYIFNEESSSIPATSPGGLFDSKIFEQVEDGIWYFHLRLQNEQGWGKTGHYRVKIDTQPPGPFELNIDNGGDPTNPRPLLYFEAEDDTSGIKQYDIQIGDDDFFPFLEEKADPFTLPHQNPGKRRIKVIAIDYAQNRTEASAELVVESIEVPQITVCPDEFVSAEEVLYLAGTALPESDVLIFFRKGDELVKQWETQSDEKGNWFLTEEGLFRSGIYNVTARTRDSRGAVSYPSKGCNVKVILSGIAIGPWIISYSSLLLLLILLFLVLLLFLIYLIYRIQRARKTIDIESKDLKKKFYKEYYELQADIKKQLEMYKKAKDYRELTPEEKAMEEQLLGNLADVERVLREELKDIEELA